MAVAKLRKLGQEDSEEQKPQQKPDREKSQHPMEIHIHMAPSSAMQKLPMYDDGGVPDTSNLPLQRPDQDVMASMDSANGPSFMQRLGSDVKAAGQAMDDQSQDPSQVANTHMYPVSGLDNKPPVMDDGGVVKAVSSMGAQMVAPDDDSAKGIAEKNKNLDEYKAGTEPKQEQPKMYTPSDKDKVSPGAKYGDKPGEERIDVSSYMKPLYDDGGEVEMQPMYDDGGPVKNDPNDGHHQEAILEEGERVLTPEQNAQYEQEHPDAKGAPADFGGRVLQQPNPPVHPKMDTEHPDTEEIGGGAKMDTSNAGVDDAHPVGDVEPPMMRPMSAKTTPTMSAPKEPTAPVPTPEGEGAPSPTAMPEGSAAAMPSMNVPPDHNPMAISASAKPLPSEREKLESERAALRQKMVDAAEGAHNNGKFDHVAYGEAKMALADLNKAHPWGQPGNHEGLLGKIGHGLAVAGEMASNSVMGPGFTAAIPGTHANLEQQSAQGQQQITQGLAGKEAEAETGLKNAQAQVAGQPKSSEEAMARAKFRLEHSPEGSPEHETAQKEYDAALGTVKDVAGSKQDVKQQSLAQQIAALSEQAVGMPQGSPERAEAEQKMAYLQQQQEKATKLTDRRRQVIAHAATMGLDPNDQKQYDQAAHDLDKSTVASKAEGGFPVWRDKTGIQNNLALARMQMQNIWNDATARGLEADKLAQKSNADFIKSTSQLATLQAALKLSDGNQVAANIVPLLSTLGFVADVGGVKRLNKQELDKFVPSHGSATRWLEANWDKITSGQLPSDYQKEMGSLVGGLQRTMEDNHSAYNKSIDSTIRKGGQEPVVEKTKEGGTKVHPQPSTPQGTSIGGHKVGGLVTQKGDQYKVTKVDANGKVLAAEKVKK